MPRRREGDVCSCLPFDPQSLPLLLSACFQLCAPLRQSLLSSRKPARKRRARVTPGDFAAFAHRGQVRGGLARLSEEESGAKRERIIKNESPPLEAFPCVLFLLRLAESLVFER